MKIPANTFSDGALGRGQFSETVQYWKQTAMQMSMESGIFVEVRISYNDRLHHSWSVLSFGEPITICFVVGEHELQSLSELKEALLLKAFL